MTPEAGQKLGPYEILGRLGSGGMGLVFRAWDARLHREVAVKLLRENYNIPGMRERFLQEARAASGLNHPNICTIFDIGEQDGDPYLVMELLQGETLKDRIARGALDAEEIIRYSEEMADALSVAHGKGIVHRDIKPANIFLVTMPSGSSQAKVLDFGLAKINLEAGGGWGSRTLDLTLAGRTVGTLAYMSPEQARGEPLDGRSDLFSLGVVMYEMATRRPPFQAANSALMFAQLFEHDPEPVRNWNDAAPRDLERMIFKLLEKDRKARYQNARDVRLALEKMEGRVSRGWLQKGTAAAVPLVRADDPVARRRGPKPKQEPDREQEQRPSEGTEALPPSPSADNLLIRPMRIPDDLPANAQLGTLHPVEEGRSQQAEFGRQGIDASKAAAEGVVAGVPAGRSTVPSLDSSAADDPLRRKSGRFEQPHSGPAQHANRGPWTDSTDLRPEIDEGESEAGADAAAGVSRRWMRVAVFTALVAFSVAAFFLVTRRGLLRPMVLRRDDRLLLTAGDNKTSDKTLDGTLMQGLEIALHQSSSLHVLGGDAYAAGLRQLHEEDGVAGAISGQRVAQKVGAKAYVYGQITGLNPPYEISIDVLRSDTNDKVASLEETASSREEIPEALGRLAQAIRGGISEDSKTEIRGSVPFAEDATPNLEALHAYAAAEEATRKDKPAEALAAYQSAAKLDPNFAQAQMRLAWIYRAEKAELASSHAAELAKRAAGKSSEKVRRLAQFCYEMNFLGNLGSAEATIRHFVDKYPRDGNGMKGLALVLLAQGYLPESLLASQQGIGEDPFDAETYNEAEEALLGLNRFDSTLEVAAQARRDGVVADGGVLPAAIMSGRDDMAAAELSSMSRFLASADPVAGPAVSYARMDRYGRYLDSTGRLNEGLTVWRRSAQRAAQSPELSSAAAYLLAQGALEEAIAENCKLATALIDQVKDMPKGPLANFHAGIAAALCGDQTYAMKTVTILQQQSPQHTAVAQDFIPELRAAADIGGSQPGDAVRAFSAAGRDERNAMVPYLRGLADGELGQAASSRIEFQTVLSHRGVSWELAGTLYPVAEIDVARAFATEKNETESAEEYRQFLKSWSSADQNQPLMKEALAKSR